MVYVVDVLMGKEDERIQRFGHDRQSTFGIGDKLSKNEWQNIFRQLVSQNLLMVDVNEHNGIKITEKGFLFLKKKESVNFRKLTEKQKARKEKSRKKPRSDWIMIWIRHFMKTSELPVSKWLKREEFPLMLSFTIKP